MKNLFIFLNILLFLCVLTLFMVFFSHKTPPPEKVLQQTPKKENIVVEDIFAGKKEPITASALALITDNDLFSPSRGVTEDTQKNAAALPKKTQFELTGICSMGTMKGAIIVNTASRNQINKKQYYAIGEQIADTAYRLIDINNEDESAIIGVGNSQFIIKLERDDQGSLVRRNRGEADSKALISLSAPPPPPQKIESVPAGNKPEAASPNQPVKPQPKTDKSPEEMKKIREDILKKMMGRRNQTNNNK